MNFRHAKTILLGALALFFAASFFSNQIGSYPLFISYNIGISIILAVSLNLINGYTGQFSLGHAGFMSVGAYTASALTLNLGPKLFGDAFLTSTAGTNVLFLFALIAGGITAALAGLIVGIPS